MVLKAKGHMSMHEDDFLRERMKRLQEAAANADPFVKKRLLRLAENYERRLVPPRPSSKPAPHETKMPSER
jgi:hypothetical protein